MLSHYRGEVIGAINNAIIATEDKMGRGGCKDFAEYRFNCGQIRGLRESMDIVSDIYDRLGEDDDD